MKTTRSSGGAAAKRSSKARAAAKSGRKAPPDPRKVPPPTAPASVAIRAAKAIAPATSVATADPNAGKALPKSVAAAAKTAATAKSTASAPAPAVPPLGADGGPLYAQARETGENFRRAVADSTTATTEGLVELNGKLLELVRAQSEATLELWRSAMTAGSLSEAVRLQTSSFRHAYETTAAQWREIAETATRMMNEAAKPLRSTFTQPR